MSAQFQIKANIMPVPSRQQRKDLSLPLVCAYLFLSVLLLVQQARATDLTPADSTTTARTAHSILLLYDTKTTAVGQSNGGLLVLTKQYAPVIDLRSGPDSRATSHPPDPSRLLQKGKVLMVGRLWGNGLLATTELYDSATKTWMTTGSLTTSYSGRALRLPRSGNAMVWGGIMVPF